MVVVSVSFRFLSAAGGPMCGWQQAYRYVVTAEIPIISRQPGEARGEVRQNRGQNRSQHLLKSNTKTL